MSINEPRVTLLSSQSKHTVLRIFLKSLPLGLAKLETPIQLYAYINLFYQSTQGSAVKKLFHNIDMGLDK